MNYIKHLAAFYEKVVTDDRLFPTHISLYLALFQSWNYHHFQNPLSINRREIMLLSKIGSLNTYHKCLHDLSDWGYIQYSPSHNPFSGSSVNLFKFDTTTDTTSGSKTIQVLRQPRLKSDTSTVQALSRSLNVINVLNKTGSERKKRAQNFQEEIFDFEKDKNNLMSNDSVEEGKEEKRKKVARKKEKSFIPPALDEVKTFFKSQEFPDLEAQKFFFHFESNGWKVGGKSPMKNWEAAAHNWMLNATRYESSNKTQSYKSNKTKDYGIPL